MKVELFGWVAELYLVQGVWYASWNRVGTGDSLTIQRYVMFLELVEFHLRELNNG